MPPRVIEIPDFPDSGTPSAKRFFKEHMRDLFIMAGGRSGLRLQELVHPSEFGDATGFEQLLPETQAFLRQLAKLREEDLTSRITAEAWYGISIARHVDNYLAYLSELVVLILRKAPLSLPPSKVFTKKLTLREVTEYSSASELLEELVEYEINQLSQAKLKDLKGLLKELGLDQTESEVEQKLLTRTFLDRNLFVHRRGIIDTRYLKQLRDEGIDIGGLVVGNHLIDTGYTPAPTFASILKSVIFMDRKACDKFGLHEVSIDAYADPATTSVHENVAIRPE